MRSLLNPAVTERVKFGGMRHHTWRLLKTVSYRIKNRFLAVNDRPYMSRVSRAWTLSAKNF